MMDLVRWMGKVYVRFVGIAVILLSVDLLSTNVAERRFEFLTWLWILASAVAGIVGGTLYLLSFDGPKRFRAVTWRRFAWALMLVAAVLPSSLTFMLVPVLLLVAPWPFKWAWSDLEEVTST